MIWPKVATASTKPSRTNSKLNGAGVYKNPCSSVRSDTIGGVMRALGYVRVSKTSEDGVSPDVQHARISRCIHSRVV